MIQNVIWFLQANWETLIALILGLVSVAELAVRLTPTKTDDGAVERVGKRIRQLLDVLKVPSVKKEDPK